MTDKIHFEYTPLSELIAYPRNPKSHDIGALDTSIKKFGYVSPVIVDTTTGYIVAGHGRVQTLMQMKNAGDKPPNRIEVDGNEWLVPVIYVVMTDEHEVMSYIVADNRLTAIGGWDEPMLADVLTDLAGAGDGLLEVTRFDGDDLDELLKQLEPQPEQDYSNQEAKSKFAIYIDCESEQHQVNLFEQLERMGITCRLLVS